MTFESTSNMPHLSTNNSIIVFLTKKIFLNEYYKIFSLNEMIEWIKNNNHHLKTTKNRLLNYAWCSFGNDISNISDKVIDYYHNLIKINWIKIYYKHLYNRIYVDDDNIYFTKENIDIDDKINIKRKIDYLMDELYTFNNIKKYITKFISQYKKKWNKIKDYNNNIKKFILIKSISNVNNKFTKNM
jgi:hypothetical protein